MLDHFDEPGLAILDKNRTGGVPKRHATSVAGYDYLLRLNSEQTITSAA